MDKRTQSVRVRVPRKGSVWSLRKGPLAGRKARVRNTTVCPTWSSATKFTEPVVNVHVELVKLSDGERIPQYGAARLAADWLAESADPWEWVVCEPPKALVQRLAKAAEKRSNEPADPKPSKGYPT